MRLYLDDNNFVQSWCEWCAVEEGTVEYNGEAPEDFYVNPNCYQLIDGELTLSPIADRERQVEEIRFRRQKECFAICDRPLWFNDLSEELKQEIIEWRHAWLEATETLIIPPRPEWL